jgi:DNA-binding NtrC family response regulator
MIDADSVSIGMPLALHRGMPSNPSGDAAFGCRNVSPGTPSPRVLVVDDHDETREFMAITLKNEGFSCVTAASVGEALNILAKEEFTAMVLDWGLDRSGAEVLRVAKEMCPSMPVVVVSGMPFDVRTDAVVKKADAFLDKPFSGMVLISQVKQLVERVRLSASIPLPQRPEDILPLQQVQALYIRHVVSLLEGNKSRAADALGIHRQTVSAALKEDAGLGG